MRGLYVHIPFCKSICTYCDFNKRVCKDEKIINQYIDRLKEDLNQYEKYFDSVKTIYIGGGTPTILSYEKLDELLSIFDKFKPLEYSIEANPETLDEKKIKILAKHHINRISIGVQTFNEESLKVLGRSHTKNDVYSAINLAKKYYINNINIDLMFAIPGADISSIKNDLKEFYKLDIKHLSYYSLILEEKTILYQKVQKNEIKMHSNDEEADMYEYIINDLEQHGFKQYEISNFSKNAESIHNKLYWQNQEYIGIGAGACGYLDHVRYKNNHLITKYLESIIEEKEYIDSSEALKEELILGLRMLDGVNIKDINDKYNINLLEKFDLKYYLDNGYITVDQNLKITKKGLLIANDIFELFI